MKKIITHTVCTIVCLQTIAQTYSSRERYNRLATVNTSVIASGGCLFTTGYCEDSTNTLGLMSYLCKHKENGEFVSVKYFKIPNRKETAIRENTTIKTSDGNFLSTGYTADSIYRCMIVKFDTDCNVLFYKEYTAMNSPSFFGYKLAEGKDGYFIQGTIQDPNGDIDLFLLKTDTGGNELWRKYYGDNSTDERAAGFIKTSANRLLVAGVKNNKDYSHDATFQSWSYLLLLDTVGNVIRDTVGTDINVSIPQSLIETQDGSYVFCTGYSTIKSNTMGTYFKGYIVKVDSNLNTLWEKKYGTESWLTLFYNLAESATGDIITCGSIYDTSYTNTNIYHNNGWLMKLTESGDSVWSREYRGVTRIGQQIETNILYDCDLLNDGSIIACGVAEDDNDTFPQQAWLLRIDADGCMDNNWCGYTGVKEIKGTNAEQPLVKVYPNPAKSILNVKYETTEAEIYIRVTDLLGRELFSKKSTGGKNTEAIATKQWSNGSYIYEVRKENIRIGSGIFVISQ